MENIMKKEEKNNTVQKKKRTSKQIVALAGVAALVLLYLITLVTAIADSTDSGSWFRLSLFGTVAIPLVIWLYTWMYARLTGKHTIGDPDSPQAPLSDTPDRKDGSDPT